MSQAARAAWKRIYLDPPGHGLTPGSDWITDQDRILEVVLAFVDATTPGERFAIGRLSLGAYLARGVLRHRSALVDGLLQVLPVVHAEDAKRSVPAYEVLVEDATLMAEATPGEAQMLEHAVVRRGVPWTNCDRLRLSPVRRPATLNSCRISARTRQGTRSPATSMRCRSHSLVRC